MSRIREERRSGFSMVELLVVIGVIGIVVALLIPGVMRVREVAARAQCQNNLKQFGLAMHAYLGTYNTFTEGANLTAADYEAGNSHNMGCFIVELLPYLEQDGLIKAIRACPAASWTNPNSGISGLADAGTVGAAAAAGVLPAGFATLRCPSDGYQQGNTRINNYAVCLGPVCMPGQCPAVQLFYPYCQPDQPLAGNAGGLNDTSYGYSTSPNYGVPPFPGNPPLDPVLHVPLVAAKDMRGIFARFRSSPAALRTADVPDGLASTIMLGEKLPDANGFYLKKYARLTATVGWASGEADQIAVTLPPINYPMNEAAQWVSDYANAYNPCNDPHNLFNYNTYWGFKSRHPGGCNFCFGDGSVSFISESINMRTYMLLGCRNDGQVVPEY